MTIESSQSSEGNWNAVHLLTVPEIAEWARVHPKTVYRWIQTNKLPAIQFGTRTYRVPEPVVAQYLSQIGYINLPKPGNNGNGQKEGA